jgi:pimeloyl-ACP methyl ester carboxylesterase
MAQGAKALHYIAVLLITALGSGPCTGTAWAEDSVDFVCSDVKISTGLSETAPQNLLVYGQFCEPSSKTSKTVQVLVHGGTYSRTYWNFLGFGGQYSYSNYMNHAGYATLAIDLLGVGGSDHPPSGLVTIYSEAYAIHSAIQAARSGALGHSFAKVILAAHSLGTLTADIEAATYQDEDGFIATGTSHGPGLLGLVEIFAHATPTLLDPVTAPQIPPGDLGYLTVVGARPTFYSGGAVDPAVEAADEATRQPDPGGYVVTLAPYIVATPLLQTNEINAPVLLVNGTGDAVFCIQGGGLATTNCATSETLYTWERPYYSTAARLQTFVLPDSGHDINLVPNAQLWYAQALQWARQVAPPN